MSTPPTHRTGARTGVTAPLAVLVGAGTAVPCADGSTRPYRDLDCAASTPAMRSVADHVSLFLPDYSSIHRGAGFKSRIATSAYEAARSLILRFAHRDGGGGGSDAGDVAIICRNTTEALNHLAYRLSFEPGDVVVTTAVEHHANLLPWNRVAERRTVECDRHGTFEVGDVIAALDSGQRPKLLAVTGASNVTGWLPPIAAICEAAHERGVPVVVDAAQLAPHRPLPTDPEFIAFSGHKLYAPFGAGALIGPRTAFMKGDPFLAGGGAVDLVEMDEVIWSDPPEREEAGSPNVVGAVALGKALEELEHIGWEAITAHESALAHQLRTGLRAIDGVRLLGPGPDVETLAVATFTVDGFHHALVAARLAVEWGIGVRHGCFCAHPYLLRLLGVPPEQVAVARRHVLAGDRRTIFGAVRASCGLGTTADDVAALLDAVAELAAGSPPPIPYHQDRATGDYFADLPPEVAAAWPPAGNPAGAACARG